MSNLINNNFQNVKLVLEKEDYWDFFIHKDCDTNYSFSKDSIYDDCLISYFDFSNHDYVSNKEIKSLDTYMWHCAHNDGKVFNNIGYTGFDNGLLNFRRDTILNSDFLDLYSNSKYDIGDKLNVVLRAVSGSTTNYEYPISVMDNCIKFNGGFYQGFFKTNKGEYQVLPHKIENGGTWGFEFVLKKCDFEKESNKTLNEKYKDNKGIFFYIGTRAENKWSYFYNNEEDECLAVDMSDYVEDSEIDLKTHKLTSFTDMDIILPIEHDFEFRDEYLNNRKNGVNDDNDSIFDLFEENKDIIEYRKKNDYFDNCETFGDDYISDSNSEECLYEYLANDLDITNAIYKTNDGFSLDKQEYYIDTDNKFLLFNRTCDGLNACTYKEGDIVRYVGTKNNFKENLFLLMNRTCTGYTACDIDKLKAESSVDYDILSDLYNNALAFRITDDGSIGYRYLIKNCDNDDGYEIKEAYSKPNIIVNDEWSVVHVKIESVLDKMKIKFYVNGNLIFISDELPMINLRELNDLYEKQETVPFNMSIGGGTQGLIETVLPNYMVDPYRVYPLEKYFAGSFIGYMKSFKFYTCNLELINISNNFNVEINKIKNV